MCEKSLSPVGSEISYKPGVISLIPERVPHEVTAGKEGLYLFAGVMSEVAYDTVKDESENINAHGLLVGGKSLI